MHTIPTKKLDKAKKLLSQSIETFDWPIKWRKRILNELNYQRIVTWHDLCAPYGANNLKCIPGISVATIENIKNFLKKNGLALGTIYDCVEIANYAPAFEGPVESLGSVQSIEEDAIKGLIMAINRLSETLDRVFVKADQRITELYGKPEQS